MTAIASVATPQPVSRNRVLLRTAGTMFVLQSLVLAPMALVVSRSMERASPGDLREGWALLEATVSGRIASPLLDLFPLFLLWLLLAAPMRIGWLSALQHPGRGIRHHLGRAAGLFVRSQLVFLAVCLLAVLPLGLGLVCVTGAVEAASTDRVAVLVGLATSLLPLLLLGAAATLLGLWHAALLDRPLGAALNLALRRLPRALPAFGAYALLNLGLLALGSWISGPAWALLALQLLSLGRLVTTAMWFQYLLRRVTI